MFLTASLTNAFWMGYQTFVPPTPNSELVNLLKKVAEDEAEAGINFKLIETGRMIMRRVLQVSNPMETKGCEEADCLPCKNGRGDEGNCRGCGINYEIECELCPDGEKGVYIGESSRNLYTKSKEYLSRHRTGALTSGKRPPRWRCQLQGQGDSQHQGLPNQAS